MMGYYTECPICMDEMSEADSLYPLLCPTKCGYNFCQNCVQHLIDSSKDDYQEASDGNRHVKVRLFCPQCRGDMRHTIEDVVLMRKAKQSEKYRHVPDSELNATELRIKHDFANLHARDVRHAQLRLKKYQTDRGEEPLPSLDIRFEDDDEDDYDGDGDDETNAKVGADDEEDSAQPGGNSDGDKRTKDKTSQRSQGNRRLKPFIDTTLFNGLDYVMSEAEQEFVMQLMTSGNPHSLAQAAQILDGIFEMSKQGGGRTGVAAPRERTWQEERKHLEELALYRKMHPLPARMPKYVQLHAFDSSVPRRAPLIFEDDEWDGSIADAFSRSLTGGGNHGKKPPTMTPGMENVLSMAETTTRPPCNRVKIQTVRGAAGKLGCQRGDVVTHFNGEAFLGNAEDLKCLVQSMYDDDRENSGGGAKDVSIQTTFQLVLNAEESTADILKLRYQASVKARQEAQQNG